MFLWTMQPKLSVKSKLFKSSHIYLHGPFICGGYLQVCQLVIATYKKIRNQCRGQRENAPYILSNDFCKEINRWKLLHISSFLPLPLSNPKHSIPFHWLADFGKTTVIATNFLRLICSKLICLWVQKFQITLQVTHRWLAIKFMKGNALFLKRSWPSLYEFVLCSLFFWRSACVKMGSV